MRLQLLPFSLGVLLLAAGCGDDSAAGAGGGGGSDGGGGSTAETTGSTGQSTSTGQAAEPGPGDFAADFETSTAFFTNMAAPAMGDSPHGMQQTWYSANIRDLVELPSFTAPEGTVAIKRFDMEGDGADDGLAVMIKKPAGYDPDNNDWYYDMRMLDGSIMPDPPPGRSACASTATRGTRRRTTSPPRSSTERPHELRPVGTRLAHAVAPFRRMQKR